VKQANLWIGLTALILGLSQLSAVIVSLALALTEKLKLLFCWESWNFAVLSTAAPIFFTMGLFEATNTQMGMPLLPSNYKACDHISAKTFLSCSEHLVQAVSITCSAVDTFRENVLYEDQQYTCGTTRSRWVKDASSFLSLMVIVHTVYWRICSSIVYMLMALCCMHLCIYYLRWANAAKVTTPWSHFSIIVLSLASYILLTAFFSFSL